MFQDIGLDQEGFMEVLIPHHTELPHEFSCRIQMNEETELCLYEGNHIDTAQNRCIGRYTLEDCRTGHFTLSLAINSEYELVISIDDRFLDKIACSQCVQDVPLEEKRRWFQAKNDFIEYVKGTILFVQDPLTQSNLPEWKWVLEKLEWAKQIEDYEVTADEYIAALHQIESMVNPVLQKTYHKTERKPNHFI
jgi:hypothetical protein